MLPAPNLITGGNKARRMNRPIKKPPSFGNNCPAPLQADRKRRLALAAAQRLRRQSRHRTIGLAVAASFLLLVLAGLFPDYLRHPLADYRTHIGEQTSIQLADGSVIHLNTDTALNVSLSNQERRVELLGGEAEFEVAHDRTRPFRVSAGHTTTEALGTRFIIRYDGNGGNVTLLQGKIRTAASNTTVNLKRRPASRFSCR